MNDAQTQSTTDVAGIDAKLHQLKNLDIRGNSYHVDRECRRILRDSPEHPQALQLRGRAELANGSVQKAKRFLERSLNANSKDVETGVYLAWAYRKLGQFEYARNLLVQILERRQNWSHALAYLGEVEYNLGNMENAIVLLEKATENDPYEPYWHFWACIAYLNTANFEKAAEEGYITTQLVPSWGAAWRNLGAAFWYLGHMQHAFDASKNAAECDPNDEGAKENVVSILREQRMYETAENFLAAEIEVRPSARMYMNLGLVYNDSFQFDKSVDPLLEALKRDPSNADIHATLGSAYSSLQMFDKSERVLYEAARQYPDSYRCLLNYAALKAYQGKKEEEHQLYEQAYAHHPDKPAVIAALADSMGKNTTPEIRQKLDQLEEAPALTPDQRARVLFTKGGIQHSDGDYKNAFNTFLKANAWVYRTLDYNPEQPKRIAEELIGTFTPNELRRMEGKGHQDDTPVLIVGTPRSGTTLSEQILSAHEEVQGVGERHDLTRIFNSRHAYTDVAEAGRDYLSALRFCGGDEARRIVDKMPDNYWVLPYLYGILPQAKAIHLRRHPLDAMLSCFRQNFAQRLEWAFNLEAMAKYYAGYRRVMSVWREILPSDFLLEIDYEDIVFNFEDTVPKMLAHADLAWSDNVTRFYANATGVITASLSQVRQPLYASSVGGWKRYKDELKPLIRFLREEGVELPADVPEVLEA